MTTEFSVDPDVNVDNCSAEPRDLEIEYGGKMTELMIEFGKKVQARYGDGEIESQTMSMLVSVFVTFACGFDVDPEYAAEHLFVHVPNSMRDHYDEIRRRDRLARKKR